MYSNKLYTPLRYPGGKGQFAPFVAEVMAQNGLAGGNYLEPYAGGAGVALELLFEGMASHIHINDLDPAIYAFWLAVTKSPKQLLALFGRHSSHDGRMVQMAQYLKRRNASDLC